MKWAETVMENLAPAIMAHPDLPMGQAIAIDQAEVSFKAGARAVVDWIRSNAIYSHDPSYEHIRINRKEWTNLTDGIIPEEREHIVFRQDHLKELGID